jgi:hypothetical protein
MSDELKDSKNDVEINVNMDELKGIEENREKVEEKEKEGSPTIIGIVEHTVEYGLRKLIFWEEDEKRIGTIIRFFHTAASILMFFIYIVNHTVFPSYILFISFYMIYLLIWLQHIICGDCIVYNIEYRMLGDKKGVLTPFMDLFGIDSDEYSSKILVMSSTIIMSMLTFELITRTIFLFKNWLF